jgi:signal peptidase I
VAVDDEAGTGPLHWGPAEGPQVPGPTGQQTPGQWTQGYGVVTAPAPRRRRRGWIVYWVIFGLLCCAFAGLIVGFRSTAGLVTASTGTISMKPGIQPGERILYQRGPDGVRRGDVVILRVPGIGLTVKRVIGLAGDHVACCDAVGRVTVDGKALDEGYLPAGYEPSSADDFQVTVGAGQIWVMGDNRADSLDSREWGPLPRGDIVGRAELITGPGGRTVLKTPQAFIAAGLAPADHRIQLPLSLLGLALLALAAIVIQGVVGIIVAVAVRRKRRRTQAYWAG